MAPQPDLASRALLEVTGLGKSFAAGGVFARGRRTTAARDVGFRIDRGESVALVGESGSGKSTLARLLLRLERPDRGRIALAGEDVLARSPRGATRGYRRRVQMVFQDPFASLNPAHDVAHHLFRPLVRLGARRAGRADAEARVRELLATVGLVPAEEFLHRHPYELSGGQRQRVAIARALAAEPELLVADEPTSMLDVSLRMGVLKLLQGLKEERGLAILLITHDLVAARFLADRILVLYRGRIVEEGATPSVVRAPLHPYTRALLSAVADAARPAGPARRVASKAAPFAASLALVEPGAGCPFAPRCAEALPVCRTDDPAPRPFDGRSVRCHLYPAPAGPPVS